MARVTDAGIPWRCVQTTDLNLVTIRDGYVPELIVLDAETLREAQKAEARHLLPSQVELVVEVTSLSMAVMGREPHPERRRPTKSTGYARSGIPHYLLVERDPRHPHIALLADPDRESGFYRSRRTWGFGDTVDLPEPFAFAIPTGSWTPWGD
jgi:hypothetical protein